MVDPVPVFPTIELPPSLKEMAFQTIKEHILGHKLKRGRIYSEQAIARELRISKTPIHQALADLEARGFLTILPRRGFQVNSLNEKDVRDLFEFRNAVEKAVILRITPDLTEEAIRHIEALNEQASRTRDPFRFLKQDRAFHLYLASLTNNRFVIDSLDNIRDLCDWVGAEVFNLRDRAEEAVREHEAVIGMLKRRDSVGAVQAMTEHLRVTELRFLSRMAKEK